MLPLPVVNAIPTQCKTPPNAIREVDEDDGRRNIDWVGAYGIEVGSGLSRENRYITVGF